MTELEPTIPKYQPIPAQTYYTPTTYINHIQMLGMGEMTVLEFRALIPDVVGRELPTDQEVLIQVEAKLNEIPPVSRVIMPPETAAQLKKMLERSLIIHEGQ